MKKAVIFDMDGTLLNTLEDLYLSTNAALARYGYPERTLEEVRQFVLNDLERGVTLLSSRGGYTETSRPVVMCVIARTQYPQLEQGVLALDKSAFIIVSDVNSVHGEGFVAPHGTV